MEHYTAVSAHAFFDVDGTACRRAVLSYVICVYRGTCIVCVVVAPHALTQHSYARSDNGQGGTTFDNAREPNYFQNARTRGLRGLVWLYTAIRPALPHGRSSCRLQVVSHWACLADGRDATVSQACFEWPHMHLARLCTSPCLQNPPQTIAKCGHEMQLCSHIETLKPLPNA
jgi:hypothetical protein